MSVFKGSASISLWSRLRPGSPGERRHEPSHDSCVEPSVSGSRGANRLAADNFGGWREEIEERVKMGEKATEAPKEEEEAPGVGHPKTGGSAAKEAP